MAQSSKIFCEQFVLKQGKCKCPGYVENPSKWSKGKCRRCLHDKSKHNFFDEETPDTDTNPPSKPIAVDPKPEATKAPETTQINPPPQDPDVQTEEAKTVDDVDPVDPVDEPEDIDLGKDTANEPELDEMKQEEQETVDIAVDPVDEAEEIKVGDDEETAKGITS